MCTLLQPKSSVIRFGTPPLSSSQCHPPNQLTGVPNLILLPGGLAHSLTQQTLSNLLPAAWTSALLYEFPPPPKKKTERDLVQRARGHFMESASQSLLKLSFLLWGRCTLTELSAFYLMLVKGNRPVC